MERDELDRVFKAEQRRAARAVDAAIVPPHSVDDVVDRLMVAMAALADAVALLKGEDKA